ncbi:MAG TPA: tetratricopeptide repeat protein [Candidatus Methanoperedens sp.]|nr:tetratricopeptide repeat protein [Candidatus Methanoperedens sp.]
MVRWLISSRWTRRLAGSLAAGVAAAFLLVLAGERWGAHRLFQRAAAAAERGEHRLAATLYAEIRERYPDHPLAFEALFQLGRTASLFLDDQAEAIRALRLLTRGAADGPSALRAQRLLGEIFETRQGDCRQAIVEYQRLISLDPDGEGSDEARFAVARCSFTLGDFEQARADFEQLLERGPAGPLRARALLGVANAWYVTGRYPQALQRYREALAAAPDPALAAEAGFGAASALEESGDLAGALAEFERVGPTYPNPGLVSQRSARIRERIVRRGALPAPPATERK